MEKIWYRTWVYVGHESEVPEKNDYVTKSMGPTPIIMVRDREGDIRLLLNKCPHRGNQLCAYKEGNSKAFVCPYHAWPFSNTGDLMGYAFPDGYEGISKSDVGLRKLARYYRYHGFRYVSLAVAGVRKRALEGEMGSGGVS